MPDVVMKNVLGLLDFTDHQSLRKVCHDLRNFIDDSKPPPGIDSIRIWVSEIEFSAPSPGSITIHYGFWNKIAMRYTQTDKGCLVAYGPGKLLENEDFIKTAVNDIELNLKDEKSRLIIFEILNGSRTFPGFRETFWMPFLENFGKSLKERPRPLSVEEFKTCPINQDEILLILPFLDSDSLDKIHFYNSFYSEEQPEEALDINEIVELEQWKKANIFKSDLYINLDHLHGNYEHLKYVWVRVKEMSSNDLLKIKETFSRSSKLENLKIRYITLIDQQPFGEPVHDEQGKEIWLFNVTNSEKTFKVLHYEDYSSEYYDFRWLES